MRVVDDEQEPVPVAGMGDDRLAGSLEQTEHVGRGLAHRKQRCKRAEWDRAGRDRCGDLGRNEAAPGRDLRRLRRESCLANTRSAREHERSGTVLADPEDDAFQLAAAADERGVLRECDLAQLDGSSTRHEQASTHLPCGRGCSGIE